MEALKQLFKSKAEFVRTEEENGNPPTDEQLASFLRNLTSDTGLALRGAPPQVCGVWQDIRKLGALL